jgi:hypothetical protein
VEQAETAATDMENALGKYKDILKLTDTELGEKFDKIAEGLDLNTLDKLGLKLASLSKDGIETLLNSVEDFLDENPSESAKEYVDALLDINLSTEEGKDKAIALAEQYDIDVESA